MEIFESEIETQFEHMPLNQEDGKVCAVILKVENKKFGIDTKPYNLNMFGKKMVDYVENAVFDTDIKFANCKFNDDILKTVQQTTNPNSKYTVVLFSDTPLFRHKTFLQIKEYFEVKRLLALKLTRGFIFQTKYLLSLENFENIQTQYFEEEDFVTCSNLKQFAMATEILKNRILDYFMKNGVVIVDPASTFVDAEVDIEPNVVIEPNNVICGKTIIKQGTHLLPGNKLTDAIICENCVLDGAQITNSIIEDGCKIANGAIVENKTKVCEGTVIPPYCCFDGVVVQKTDNLKCFAHYVARED